jgi:hypothetical protein
VGGEVAPAGFLGRLGADQGLVQQGLDGVGRGRADGALLGGRVVGRQQAGRLGGLAQQLGAGALAQGGLVQRDGLVGVDQGTPLTRGRIMGLR